MTTHKIVVGLGFGDEGKGTIVDALCAKDDYGFVVRFSGGPQAAHNVVLDDGRHHTFSQFGSGTFSGTRTILSRYMLFNPFNLIVEADALFPKIGYDPLELLFVSENALVITPYHVEANKLREIARGADRHGSCAQGVGETQRFALEFPEKALRVRDLVTLSEQELADKLFSIRRILTIDVDAQGALAEASLRTARAYKNLLQERPFRVVTDEWISSAIKARACVFEGSQGVLLDENRGFHPYTTWATTGPDNAYSLLVEAKGTALSDIETIGVIRTYHTRHGAGPFPTELLGMGLEEKHNGWGEFQGHWRTGILDLNMVKYARSVSGPLDYVAVTHMDVKYPFVIPCYGKDLDTEIFDNRGEGDILEIQERMTKKLMDIGIRDMERFDGMSPLSQVKNSREISELIADRVGAPVKIRSWGAERGKKEFLR